MRLFVAINFPGTVVDSVWGATESLRSGSFPIRWVPKDAIHLTLKFLGDVEDERLDQVEAALRNAVTGTKSFTVEIGGAGAFPNPRRPSVVWVGCTTTPPLELLQDSIERRYHDVGFEVDGRPFRPHVTIGRARHGARRHGFADLERQLAEIELGVQSAVSSVELMRSSLGPGGARYDIRHTAPLDS